MSGDDVNESSTVEVGDGEEYALLPDGRIRLGFEHKVFTLRRPRLGEFKELRLKFLELAAANSDEQITLAETWIETTFAALADRKLNVQKDDWPTWLVMGVPFGEWITHWRDIPLARGGPEGPTT